MVRVELARPQLATRRQMYGGPCCRRLGRQAPRFAEEPCAPAPAAVPLFTIGRLSWRGAIMSTYCQEIQDRIEQQIEQPVESWVETRRKKCKKKKCRKLCLCCNKWLCWIETFVERVITLVIINIVKWVSRLVCEI